MIRARVAPFLLAIAFSTMGGACQLMLVLDPPEGHGAGASEAGIEPPDGSQPHSDAADGAAPSDVGEVDARQNDAASDKYASAVLQDQPLAYYRLDDTKGLRAADAIGQHDGAYEGAVTLGVKGLLPGSPNAAASFSGGRTIMTTNDFAFTGATAVPFSVELWAKPDVVNALQHIFTDQDRNVPKKGYAIVFFGGSGPKFERTIADDERSAVAADALQVDQTVYLVGTYDGQKLRLYVNSALAVEADDTRAMPTYIALPRIGVADGDGLYPFIGTIDEVAIYDHALDPARIAAHYQAATGL